MGKSVAESRAEIAMRLSLAVRIHGRYRANTTGKGCILTMHQPVGPCVFVTPTTATGTRKLARDRRRLHDGLSSRPSRAPLLMLALTKLLEEAGLPAGVLNVSPRSTPAR